MPNERWENRKILGRIETGQTCISVTDQSNYRPISLTCVLFKILEHIAASSLVKLFTELDIFYEMQRGF